jgi:hypothetical protein
MPQGVQQYIASGDLTIPEKIAPAAKGCAIKRAPNSLNPMRLSES